MLPEIWGKYAWCFFHLVTMGYPEHPAKKDKKHYYKYICSLKYILPCDRCKQNLKNHLKKYPLTDAALSSKSNLVKWGIDLHNIVNYYTGKPMLSYTESLNELNKLANPVNNNKPDYVPYLIVGVVILIIFFVAFYRPKKN